MIIVIPPRVHKDKLAPLRIIVPDFVGLLRQFEGIAFYLVRLKVPHVVRASGGVLLALGAAVLLWALLGRAPAAAQSETQGET